MNTLAELLQAPWLDTLAYTLLHSLWQGALIVLVVITLLRFTPLRLSSVRYKIASVGLLLLVGSSVLTFLILHDETTLSSSAAAATSINFSQSTFTTAEPFNLISIADSISVFIRSNIPLFLMLWFAGAFVFCLRVIGGLLYINRLRKEASLIDGDWNAYLQKLVHRLSIRQCVSLASSSSITAPVVIGFIKPIILVPVGMLTTLSTEQLETIFLHELIHIKRKDFLINLVQSFVEAFFFFNPFSWMLSGLIRREREHRCDDAVVKFHGNALVYAHALSTLEEARLSKVGLSLSLAQNKNQLLNRITRIMEKSVKNYSGRERIIPAALLIMGLICASWISTHTGTNEFGYRHDLKEQVVQDTTKKAKKLKREKKASAESSKETSSSDREERTAKKNEGEDDDASLYPGPIPVNPDFDMPPMPDVAFPPIPEIELGDFDVPHMQWQNEGEWEAFGREFGERFQEKFGDFYEKHGEDIQKMIQEIEQDLTGKLDGNLEAKIQNLARKQAEWQSAVAEWQSAKQAEQLERQIEADRFRADRFREESKRLAEKAEVLSDDIKKRHADEFERNHKRFEESMKAFEERTRHFEEAMREELIKDGYLEKDEKLTNMHWKNGSIEINGKKIKPEHEKKYNDIRKKHFEDNALKTFE